MATTIQLRRGTTAQVDAVTPVSGEPVWETDGLKLAIGDASTAGGLHVMMASGGTFTGAITVVDDVHLHLGTDGDQVFLNRSTSLNANTAVTGVLIGTPVTQAIADNSLMISNITASGDIALYVNKGGHSQMVFFADASAGDTALLAASGGSVDFYIAGTKLLDYATGAFAFQQNVTISSTGTLTLGAITLSGAITGGDQSFTNVGDMTFAAGSILASGGTNADTFLLKANDTTFITFTTAATDVCELDGCTLDSSIAKGTWTASGTWTIPAHITGNITLSGQSILSNFDNSYVWVSGGTDGNSAAIWLLGKSYAVIPGTMYITTPDAALTSGIQRLNISGAVATAVATWASITHTGLAITATGMITGAVNNSYWYLKGGLNVAGGGGYIFLDAVGEAGTGKIVFGTPDAAGTGDVDRLEIRGKAATVVAAWTNITQVGLVLGGNMTVTGYVFDAGAGSAQINTTGALQGLTIQCTNDGIYGAAIYFKNISASPATNDYISCFYGYGKDSVGNEQEYSNIYTMIESPTSTAEGCKFGISLYNAGGWNDAMTLSGAGTLWIDQNLIMDTGYIRLKEIAAPGALGADLVGIYAVVGGDTLTDLAAVFQDGTVDIFAQEATEPDSPIFQFPDMTDLKLQLRKPDRKTVQFAAIFPDGREFIMRELRYPSPRWN